jgi:hypothetical protein
MQYNDELMRVRLYHRVKRICKRVERDMARINDGKKPAKAKYQ